MDGAQEEIKNKFNDHLKAKDYIEVVSAAYKEDPECPRFMLMGLNNIFRSGRFKGTKLLELGSGATVHNIAAASAYFSNITMSDYVLDTMESLKKWLKGDSDLPQLLDIQAGLEGYGNDLDTGKKILETRIRKAVKSVVRCDVLAENILVEDSKDPNTSPPFDVIISCLCLETAPKDYAGYKKSLKNVSKLLRPGGGLVLCGFFQGSTWSVNGIAFNHIKIGEKELLDALTAAGFGKFDLKTRKGMDSFEHGEFSCSENFCIAAEKL